MEPYVYRFLLNKGWSNAANALVAEAGLDPLLPIDDGVLTVIWPQTGQSAAHSATQNIPPSFGSNPMFPHEYPPVQSFTPNTMLLRGNNPQNATQNMGPYSTRSYRPNTGVPDVSHFRPPYIHESTPFGSNSVMPSFGLNTGVPAVSYFMPPYIHEFTPFGSNSAMPSFGPNTGVPAVSFSMPPYIHESMPFSSNPVMPSFDPYTGIPDVYNTWRNNPLDVSPVMPWPTNVTGMLGQGQPTPLPTDIPSASHFPTGFNARFMQEQPDNLSGKRMHEEGQHSTQSRPSEPEIARENRQKRMNHIRETHPYSGRNLQIGQRPPMQQNFQVPQPRVARDNTQMQPSGSAPTGGSHPNESALPTQQILNSSQPQMARGRGTNMGRNMCYRHYSDSIGSSSSNPKNSDAGNPKKSSS